MQKSKNTLPINIDLFVEQARAEILCSFPDGQNDYSHCIQHTDRVVKMARHLCRQEGGDYFVISLAALFHDIARSMEDKGECLDHAKKGAELTKDILLKHKVSVDIIGEVVYCIQNHRSDGQGRTLESKILRDADKLDSLGAICVSRVIASSLQSRQYCRPIFDSSIPLSGHETASAVHYLVLLIERYKNNNYFFTKTALNMAKERVQIMEEFVEQFKKEWFFN